MFVTVFVIGYYKYITIVTVTVTVNVNVNVINIYDKWR